MAQAQRGKIKVKRGESLDDEVMMAKQIEDFKNDLKFGTFDPDCQMRQTQFFSNSVPKLIFRDLIGYLAKKGVTKVRKSEIMWKLRFETLTGENVCCTILLVEEGKYCVEFVRG